MKKTMQKLVSLTAAMLLAVSLSATAFAAGSTVRFNGKDQNITVEPGSEFTATDLFDNFKDVMPGDVRTEEITIQNNSADCDYMRIYMRAVPHDETTNPLSSKVAETETVATMTDFLSQLSVKVWNGSTLIYEASPDELNGLKKNFYLGDVGRGKTANLKVELSVPATLGNEYANRVGEVDWAFQVEGITGETLVQTGQLNWPVPVLCGLGVLLVVLGIYLNRRKRNTEHHAE